MIYSGSEKNRFQVRSGKLLNSKYISKKSQNLGNFRNFRNLKHEYRVYRKYMWKFLNRSSSIYNKLI